MTVELPSLASMALVSCLADSCSGCAHCVRNDQDTHARVILSFHLAVYGMFTHILKSDRHVLMMRPSGVYFSTFVACIIIFCRTRVAWYRFHLVTVRLLFMSITISMIIFFLGPISLQANYAYNVLVLLAQ